MDRNNGRYTYVRRQSGQNQQQQHQHHQQSSSSLSSSSSSSHSSTSNNNQQQHLDNHRNSSASSTTSSQFSSSTNNTTPSVYASQSSAPMSREPLTQHDELIRYIREAWTKVSEQGTPIIYRNESDHQLKNFKPFNLEEYWGQRLVQNIHVSHGHQ